MNIYAAFHKAAELIESRPEMYRYMHFLVPERGAPGCMLGLAAQFMGIAHGKSVHTEMFKYMHVNNWIELGDYAAQNGFVDTGYNHKTAAAFLRWYADKHFASKPDWNEMARKLAAEPCAEIKEIKLC